VKRLLIVRHAKAVKGGPRVRDFDRTLAERGLDDAVEMGRRLALRGEHPAVVVSSPAARALETARLLCRELDFPWDEIRTVKAAYLADAETLIELVRELDDRAETALLVGHNPGCTELAQALARDFALELPTCAIVALDLRADTWAGVRRRGGALRWYDYPGNRP
jgi:phosphohistidine phosphatase